jgi:hypothetical protein
MESVLRSVAASADREKIEEMELSQEPEAIA